MKETKWQFNLRTILMSSILLCLTGFNWQSYDTQWQHRNPKSRLEILDRGVGHYQKAVLLSQQGNIKEAEQWAHDALKVIPEFIESYDLLVYLYKMEGDSKGAEKWFNKSVPYRDRQPTVPEEYVYLSQNIERLMNQYEPPQLLNRIMFYIISLMGLGVLAFILSSSGIIDDIAMKVRRMVRHTTKPEKDSPLILGEFPGGEKEKILHWSIALTIYVIPFVICFLIPFLSGIRSVAVLIFCTVVPGLFIDVFIYKIFFDDDVEPPMKFMK